MLYDPIPYMQKTKLLRETDALYVLYKAPLPSPCRCTSAARARIFKRLRSPEIDSEESIPSAYVAWRARSEK